MLPMKLDLTEELAATLRQLRLNHPVNGEVLTAENLSKAIGNNRAWMSQIESRRLKKIKREDIIKIYKLLYNEPDDAKAERKAESTLMLFDNDIYISEDIAGITNCLNEIKNVLISQYNSLASEESKLELISCLKTIKHNFKYNYVHACKIYGIPFAITGDTNIFLRNEIKDIYINGLDDIISVYQNSINNLTKRLEVESFIKYSTEIYQNIIKKINTMSIASTLGDITSVIFEIIGFGNCLISYIKIKQKNKDILSTTINIDDAFDMLIQMITLLSNVIQYEQFKYSIKAPSIESTPDELAELELNLNNALLDIIKYVFSN